ncbi:Ubiquitin carboxyl-terminal hydrolase CYLD [Orchesella cincta]|uniref:Ubiquitin carboxyl-terminal hydrolase CYLD n=1 Tax=Orchesella cincta TaxID=48709 RepID=A0A1D2ML48_ORCCI|nr:Ubiquitin carboxyl-terminal hydrolase CYLD [Orchesella cincta]
MAKSEENPSELLQDSKWKYRRVFCRVPFVEYLISGTLLHSFVENEANLDGIIKSTRKAEIEVNDPWLLKALMKQGFTSVKSLILPESLIRTCAVPDVTQLESLEDTFFTESNVPAKIVHQYTTYAFKSVKNLRPGQVVVWYHPNSEFILGKVYFTGIEVRKFSNGGLTVQSSDITVFVSFQQYQTDLSRIYYEKNTDLKTRKYIYVVDCNNLLSLSNFTNLMETTSVWNFKYELRTPGTLEIKTTEQVGSSIVISPTEVIRDAVQSPSNTLYHDSPTPATECTSKLDSSKSQYLTRSKVADSPDFYKQFENKVVLDLSKTIAAQTPSRPLNAEVSNNKIETENKDTPNREQNNRNVEFRSIETSKKAKFDSDKPHTRTQQNSDTKNPLNVRPFSEETEWPPVHRASENKNVSYTDDRTQLDTFVKLPIQYNHGQFNVRGIQGFNNSCYVDSVLFSLFAFTNVFDKSLEKPKISEDNVFADSNILISKILKYSIISPLRETGFVPSTAIQKLREAMLIYNPTFNGGLMDAEDFILTLFEKICDIPKFYVFNNEAEDFVFQIHVLYQQEKKTTADLQKLLQRSFQEIDVKLCKLPFPAFIVKLPVCHGDPLFEKVLPNLVITLDRILDAKLLKSAGIGFENRMLLRAIICLKNQHYTSFVRITNDRYSHWVYFDSKPGSLDPEVVLLRNFSEVLENPTEVYQTYSPRSLSYKGIDFAMRNAYICIYEPFRVQETLL